MNKNTILITATIALIVGSLSFFAGTKYQQSKVKNLRSQFGNQTQGFGQTGQGQANMRNGNGSAGVGRGNFRPVNGEITSADDNSITVKLTDGSSKIVILSEKTAINKADTATIADLTVGETVAVFGSENTDGSVTAQNIQLNPTLQGMPDTMPTGFQPTP